VTEPGTAATEGSDDVRATVESLSGALSRVTSAVTVAGDVTVPTSRRSSTTNGVGVVSPPHPIVRTITTPAVMTPAVERRMLGLVTVAFPSANDRSSTAGLSSVRLSPL
jgi:hypothetical protein